MSEPVENRFWRTPKGGTLSLFSTGVPPGSTVVSWGWTVAHPDGTRGLGRPPFETREEAQAWCDANPDFPGMAQG